MSTGSKQERGSRASDEESKTAVKVGTFSIPAAAHIPFDRRAVVAHRAPYSYSSSTLRAAWLL